MNPNYAVVDVETTGLDPHNDSLLEIAVVIVDTDLNVISPEPFHAIVRFSDEEADAMFTASAPVVQQMHTATGLWGKISSLESVPLARIDANLLEWLALYGAAGTMPVMGNSVRLDMNFMDRHLPRSAAFLDYHMRDVSTIAGLATDWYGIPPYPKAKSHTALADVLECIEELRYYRTMMFGPRSVAQSKLAEIADLTFDPIGNHPEFGTDLFAFIAKQFEKVGEVLKRG